MIFERGITILLLISGRNFPSTFVFFSTPAVRGGEYLNPRILQAIIIWKNLFQRKIKIQVQYCKDRSIKAVSLKNFQDSVWFELLINLWFFSILIILKFDFRNLSCRGTWRGWKGNAHPQNDNICCRNSILISIYFGREGRTPRYIYF